MSPLASPTLPVTPESAAIAGWVSLVLELSAGSAGLRIVQALLDAGGRPLSGSDHVLFRSELARPGEPVRIRQESIGGRLEPDGDFRGTFWLVTGPEPEDEAEPEWEMTPRQPTAAEVDGLKELVAELVRRSRWRSGAGGIS